MNATYIATSLLVLCLAFTACDTTNTTTNGEETTDPPFNNAPTTITTNSTLGTPSKDGFPYDLKYPYRKFSLPDQLEEISGLGWHEEGELIAVQDEQGYLYFYDLNKGKVDHKVKFGSAGDYEGVELAGETMWAVKSSGDLMRIPEYEGIEVPSQKIETPLKTSDDVEGLTYDSQTEMLLVACKANSDDHAAVPAPQKGIFAIDPLTGEMDEKPRYIIDPDELGKFREQDKPDKFHPSGIAFHPSRPEVYIIAAIDNRVLVLQRETGEILFYKKLKSKSFKQAEGICFAPDGTLYISNEGAGGDANILEFPMLESGE